MTRPLHKTYADMDCAVLLAYQAEHDLCRVLDYLDLTGRAIDVRDKVRDINERIRELADEIYRMMDEVENKMEVDE